MFGFSQTFNRLSETFNLKSVGSPPALFQEIVQNENRDLVFICEGGVMLAYHSEIVANLSSVLRDVLKLDNIGQSKLYTPKNAQIFVTLAEVNSNTVRSIMNSIYSYDILEFSNISSTDIKSVFSSLGISESFFNVTEIGKEDAEDSQIVDVIQDLMEEFNVNPQQSEKELQDMLINNVGDGFFTKISESNLIDGGDDFFGLEHLMAEPGDDIEFDQDDVTVDETVAIPVDNRLNVSIQNADVPDMPDLHDVYGVKGKDLTVKKCFVEMSNIPNETLKHYINIAQDNITKTAKRRPETEAEQQRRKRRKNINTEYEYEEGNESLTIQNVTAEVTTDNVESKPLSKIPEFLEKVPVAPTPQPTVKEALDSTEIQFVETKQVSCMICEEVFKVRSKIIQHLCVSHFSNQIFALYPFVKGGNCPICVKTGKAKPTQLRDKNAHVRHIGQAHEVIFDIITPEFKESIDQFAKTTKRAHPKYRVKEEKVEVVDNIQESSNSSFQESPEDNYMKLLKDFTENYESSSKIPEEKPAEEEYASVNETAKDDSMFSQSDQSLLEKYCIEVESSKSDPQPEDDPGQKSLLCSLCPISDLVSFRYKSNILIHLSSQHLSRELLTVYPFTEGQACEVCEESVSNSATDYANHIGSFHEKVLELLPTDLCERIEAMPKEKDQNSETKPYEISGFQPDLNSTFMEEAVVTVSNPPAESDCELCHQTGIPSRADFLLHYATKHYQHQILRLIPFQDSMPCTICVETRNPKAFVAKNGYRHLKHIGVMHEKVLNFMSITARSKIESKFQIKKKLGNFTPEAFGASILKNVTISTASSLVVFNCKLCVKSFETEDLLKEHTKTHKEGRNYNCRYCGQTSDNAKQFKLHLLSHKNELSKAKLT